MRFGRRTALVATPLVLLAGLAFEATATPASPLTSPRLNYAATSDSLPRADSLEAVIVELRIGRLARILQHVQQINLRPEGAGELDAVTQGRF